MCSSDLQLLGSTYGSIVLAKAVAFAWLVRLGWLQRRRALDRLPDTSALAVVARISGAELLIMASALGAAVVLGRIGAPTIPTPGFAPLTLVALGIAAPMLVVAIRSSGWRALAALPEVAMIVLLFVMVLIGGVGPGRRLLGGGGLLLELALLLIVGCLAAGAVRTSSARTALVVGMAGLPLALAAVLVLNHATSVSMAFVSLVAGEILLAGSWRALAPRAESVTPLATVGG